MDSYRDLMSGVLDTHLSTVSNRLNVVMKQLTIIATIFLPLSFLTGFFGQNFGALVHWIAPTWTFWVLAVAVDIVTSVGLIWVFRRRGLKRTSSWKAWRARATCITTRVTHRSRRWTR